MTPEWIAIACDADRNDARREIFTLYHAMKDYEEEVIENDENPTFACNG